MTMTLTEGIIIILTAGQLLFAALDFFGRRAAYMQNDQQPRRRHPTLVIGLFMVLTWAAVAFNYYSRPPVSPAQFVSYGLVGQNQFQGVVQFHNWSDYKNYKAILITRTIFSDRDRMTDPWIAKSIPYTIDGPALALLTISKGEQMRFASEQNNLIEYNFAVLPANILPEQIISLSDVAKVGGQILTVAALGGVLGDKPPAAAPK